MGLNEIITYQQWTEKSPFEEMKWKSCVFESFGTERALCSCCVILDREVFGGCIAVSLLLLPFHSGLTVTLAQ